MVSINQVSINTYTDVDISVDDIYEALSDAEAKEMLGLLLYNASDKSIIPVIKEFLEEAAEELGYREVLV